MLYAISYDVVDDRRRLQVSHALLDYGERVQKSVFECNFELDRLAELVKRLSSVINAAEDSVRIYPICGNCKESIKIIGQGRVTEDPEVYIL
jgi:CRISPR-associated protein Cas2